MATVREKAKRAEKDGLCVVIYHGKITDEGYLKQIELISRAWLAKKGGMEMGFSQGQFDPQGDSEQLYALAVDSNNQVHAFMTFAPIYGRFGWTIDLMRRAEHTSPGTMDLVLSRMIEYLKNMGAEMLSLGLAPMHNANEEQETFIGSSFDFLTEHLGNPAKNQSLSYFKKKFQPTWESRYLAYSDALSLPKIGWALYRAHQTDVSLARAIRRSLAEWHRGRQEQQQSTSPALGTAKA